jgi:hypothetical protein
MLLYTERICEKKIWSKTQIALKSHIQKSENLVNAFKKTAFLIKQQYLINSKNISILMFFVRMKVALVYLPEIGMP